MKNIISWLLTSCGLLLLLTACSSSPSIPSGRIDHVSRLDNMDVMGNYTLNNVVLLSAIPLSKDQISIKVKSNIGCQFSGTGPLSNNTVMISGVSFYFSKQSVMVTGNGLGKCGGEYLKTF